MARVVRPNLEAISGAVSPAAIRIPSWLSSVMVHDLRASLLPCRSEPSLSHSAISAGAIVRFGRCGSSVPALTSDAFLIFASAHLLASRSVRNVSADRRRVTLRPGRGFDLNETYQV